MKSMHRSILLLLLISSCGENHEAQPIMKEQVQIKSFPMDCDIRAITAVSDDEVWFGGSKGQFGYTKDGGETWHIDSIKSPKKEELEFRGIAKTSNALFLLAVGSPALMFRSVDGGQQWSVAYEEQHPAAFYDAIAFWDDQYGIAMGDPTGECLSIILTEDGGESWEKIPCDRLPAVGENEAAFAASNSNIAIAGDQAWIVTGGGRARVFHSPDRGTTWEVYETPIVQGGKMTGIFTVSFYDQQHGIIFGGDWENQAQRTGNKAITADGGKTWTLIADGQAPGYRSSVQYLPGSQRQRIIAAGIPGISYSDDGGRQWVKLSDSTFYTIRVCDSGTSAWLGGPGKMGKMTW